MFFPGRMINAFLVKGFRIFTCLSCFSDSPRAVVRSLAVLAPLAGTPVPPEQASGLVQRKARLQRAARASEAAHNLQSAFALAAGFLQTKSSSWDGYPLTPASDGLTLCRTNGIISYKLSHRTSSAYHQLQLPASPFPSHSAPLFLASRPLSSAESAAREVWLPPALQVPPPYLPALRVPPALCSTATICSGQAVQEPWGLREQPTSPNSQPQCHRAREGICSLPWEKHLTFQNSMAFKREWRRIGSSPR